MVLHFSEISILHAAPACTISAHIYRPIGTFFIDQLALFKYNQMQSDAEQEDFLAQDQCYAVEEKVGIETIDFDKSS